MSNLMDLLKSQLTDSVVSGLANQIGGGASADQTKAAAGSVFEVLTGALGNSAQKEGGSSLLESILDRDHDGSILDDVAGFITGSGGASGKSSDGAGILGHLLGGKQDQVASALGAKHGLDGSQMTSMLTKLAPLVMGALGKSKSQGGGITDLLSSALSGSAGGNSGMMGNLMTSFLDKDGDGSVTDDLMGMFGNMMKK